MGGLSTFHPIVRDSRSSYTEWTSEKWHSHKAFFRLHDIGSVVSEKRAADLFKGLWFIGIDVACSVAFHGQHTE